MEQQILVDLINEQLKPHNKSFTDVEEKTNWFMKYTTTKDEQSRFMVWAVSHLMENLGISRKLAEIEVSWFVLSYGLKLHPLEEVKES